jgi:hypothetical protein
MEFWNGVGAVAGIGVLGLVAIFMLLWFISSIAEICQFNAGFHDLQLAYQISREDIESLTKEDWKMIRRMSYDERTSFLKERFPDSVPAITKSECN